MKISARGIDLIKQFEGFKAEAYKCPAGVWTIGYGFTSDVKQGDTIARSDADKRLISELGYYERVIEKHVKKPLTQSQFDALASFVFNIGEGAFVKSTMLKLLNKGDMVGASAQFSRWDKAKGMVLQGLVRRRRAEADLFDSQISESAMVQSVDAPDKPLSKSRTIAGSSIAATATIAGEVVNETKEHIEPLLPYAESLKTLFVVIALIGIGLAIYARIDDRRKA